MEIDFPSPLGVRTKEKSLPASHPCLREEKSGEKNRGGDITPMRLRRSLFFIAPATPAGRPCGASPARPSRPSPADPAGPAAVCPAPPSCPRLPRPRRIRPVEPSCTRCAGAAGGRASAQAHGRRVLVANQVSEGPLSSSWVRKGRTTKNRRPDRRARRPVTACLRAVARLLRRYGVAMAWLWSGMERHIAPEPVSAHRPPFSVGLTTSAVSGSSRRPPGCFRCGQRHICTHAEKGERSRLHKQGNFLYCVDRCDSLHAR